MKIWKNYYVALKKIKKIKVKVKDDKSKDKVNFKCKGGSLPHAPKPAAFPLPPLRGVPPQRPA